MKACLTTESWYILNPSYNVVGETTPTHTNKFFVVVFSVLIWVLIYSRGAAPKAMK